MKSILMLLLCLPIFASDLSEVPEKDLRRQADGGDLHALTELAFRYQEGEIVPFDKPFIFAALTRAAEGGVARAYTGLGLCHAGCIGVALRDDDEAGRYYQMAAEKKDPEGLYYLSRRYREGRSVPMDLVKAQELLEESANLDFRLAKVPLVRASLAGDGVPRDLKALDELILLAEDQKNAPAAYAVGMYYHGDTYSKGVQRPVLARKYLTLAADRRHAGAMLELAKMELTPPRGKKMNANELREARRKASVWYRKAAERNNPERMLRLARLLQRNANLRLEGEDWYRYLLTADQMGNDEATIELADINYHAPEYTYRDLDWSESAYYYQKYLNDCHAAKPGATFRYTHAAIHKLCQLYYEGGLGLDRDYQKCIAVAGPFLGRCEIATAYAGRALLHPDAPLGDSREHFVRGYACMLSARDQGYVITDNALFQLRSRHNLTREETARAESLRAGGFPTPSTSLLP